MKIKLTSVYVDDQEKALRFYTEVLGFVKKADFSQGSYRWLTVASAEDPNGQVYFATPLGVQVCEANGRHAAILNPPEHGSIAGFAFAGKNLDWLYVAEGSKLFRRPLKITGTAPWNPVKPPKPPL